MAVATPVIAQEVPTSNPPSAESIASQVEDIRPSTKAALFLPVAALAIPQVADVVSPIVSDPESGVAIDGYDPVGFFTANEAIKGDARYVANYGDVKFHFVSEENRDLFLKDPERYAPAFGGYCSHSLASGVLTPGSPEHWTIHGNRLYFTRSSGSTKVFREETALSVAAADRYWEDSPLGDTDRYNFRASK